MPIKTCPLCKTDVWDTEPNHNCRIIKISNKHNVETKIYVDIATPSNSDEVKTMLINKNNLK